MNANENAYLDFLAARERALEAAAGYFATANVPSETLAVIADQASEAIITLAARVVLYQRSAHAPGA